MNKIQLSCALIILSALLCIPANALALSDLDTRFSIQVHGRDRQLQCDFLTISNENLNCTDGALLEQIPLSRIKQLDVVYMGKEFSVSEVNESDIKSVNAMNMKKEQTVSKKRAFLAKKRKRSAPSKALPEASGEDDIQQIASEGKGTDDSNSYSDRLYELEHKRLVAKRDSYCQKWRKCKGAKKVLYEKYDQKIKLLESDPEQYFYNISVRKARRNNQAAATSAGSQGNITGEWDSQGRHYTPAGGENAWRDDGVFMQKAAGGYINTQTGEFVPAN